MLAGVVALVVVAGWPIWDAAPHRPILDQAVHELLIRDVGTADTPLLGPATTGGMHHPGPGGLAVLAVVYRVLGSTSEAALVGAGLVALGSALASIAVVGRVAGRTIGWVAAVAVALLLVSAGPERVFDVWNPNLALVPFLLLLVSAWAVTCGRVALLPVVAVTASFAVQNHVSFAVPVVAVLAWCGLGVVLDRRRPEARPEARPFGRWALAALVVGVVCWAPPLLEEVTGAPGNLSALAGYTGSARDTVTAGTAVGVLARHVGGVPTWAGAPESTPGSPTVVDPAPVVALVVPGLALAAAAWVAWTRRRRELALLLVTVVVALGGCLVAVAQVSGPLYLHYTRMCWPVGMLLWVGVVWAAIDALRPRQRVAVDRAAAPVGVVCLVVLAAVGWVARPPHPWPAPPDEAGVVATVDALVAALPDDLTGPVRVDGDGTLEGMKLQTATQLQLERAGVPVAVPASMAVYYGDHRAARSAAYVLTIETRPAADGPADDGPADDGPADDGPALDGPAGEIVLDRDQPRVRVRLTPVG